VIDAIYRRIAAHGDDHGRISLIPRHAALAAAARLCAGYVCTGALPPLWGLPFAVRDNIDLAGVATRAACPAYAYIPEHLPAVVERLTAAGTIAIGKANLDQFATGLVGVHALCSATPPCDRACSPGGSSSGSDHRVYYRGRRQLFSRGYVPRLLSSGEIASLAAASVGPN
jgi:allophanate hydrolase